MTVRTSQDIDKLAAALTKAQGEIKNAVKSGVNTFFNKEKGGSKYVPLDELIPVCKDALNANGIAFVQGAEQSESGEVLHLSTMLLHTSGQFIESTLTMRPVKADPQGIGSCITYARRYALAAICGVASEDDDDGNAASQAPAKPAPKKPEPTPPGGQEFDERKALMGRIQVQKARKGAKDLAANVWDSLLTKAFDTADRTEIANLSPMQLKAGIDKLAALIDEIEGV